MKEKHETIAEPHLFYCFVDFGNAFDKQPVCYILPSSLVAQVLRENQLLWMKKPGKRGQSHNETSFRRLLPDYTRKLPASKQSAGWLDSYREAWHLFSINNEDHLPLA